MVILLFAATRTDVFVLLKLPDQYPSLQFFAALAVHTITVPSFIAEPFLTVFPSAVFTDMVPFTVLPIAILTYLYLNAALIFMFFVTVSFTVPPFLPLASPPQADRSQCFAGTALHTITVPSCTSCPFAIFLPSAVFTVIFPFLTDAIFTFAYLALNAAPTVMFPSRACSNVLSV